MKVELLAPAGSYEALEAAFEAGADAVYLGGQKFGARAYADNLDQEQLIRAIDLAHLKGKQLYLTINTLLKNRELEEELYAYLAPLYEAGLDAVIVQDLGVMEFIKTYFPKLHIHASTQMTITGVESAKLLKKAGATRVVTARELLLEEIKKIYDATHMEIESFVHGALCYCYSGQCLMSSMIGGRSGNRGRCAQPCRLPYQVYRDGKRLNNEQTAYALSPKDMCTVEILPEIIEAGVYSLKIEGRMKKPEYTAGVVSVYRKYLDRYLAGEKRPVVTEEDRKILWDIYNRDGFHQSYYKQRNGRSMMALENEKSGGTIRNEELFSRIRKEYMEKKTPVPVQGTLTVYTGCPAILEVQAGDVSVTVEGETVQAATNCPLGEDRIRRQMEKTGGSGFAFEKLDIFMGDDIFLPMQQLNHLRRQALEALQKEMLRPWKQRKAKERDPKDVPDVKKQTAPGTLSAAVQTNEQLAAVAQTDGIRRIYADCGIFPVKDFAQDVEAWINRLQTAGKELFLTLPRIVRDRELDGRKETFTELVQKGLAVFTQTGAAAAYGGSHGSYGAGLADYPFVQTCLQTAQAFALCLVHAVGRHTACLADNVCHVVFGQDAFALAANVGNAFGGGSLIQKVDGLVGQKAAGQIPNAQLHGGVDGFGRHDHPVIAFVSGHQPGQNLFSLARRGFLDHDLAKTPFQRRVLLYGLAIFLRCGGTDQLDLAPRQHRF